MRPETVQGQTVPARIAQAFEAALGSNTYAVLHLKREADGLRGERLIYKSEAVAFLKRLTIRVRGKNSYLRRPPGKRFLVNAVSVEKLDDCPHFNLMIRRPEHIDFETFRTMIEEEWIKSVWASTDANALQIEPRHEGTDLFGYCHKEGDEALIFETLTF